MHFAKWNDIKTFVLKIFFYPFFWFGLVLPFRVVNAIYIASLKLVIYFYTAPYGLYVEISQRE